MRQSAYFVAEKRLSKEFAETVGCAPATRPSWGAAGADAGAGDADAAASIAAGLVAGWAEACLASALGAGVFGAAALASATLGLTGAGCAAVAVESGDEPTRPTLRARLEKKPSDCVF